jgi:hypothetical protein
MMVTCAPRQRAAAATRAPPRKPRALRAARTGTGGICGDQRHGVRSGVWA